jgi:ankyrin repeat protein
MERKDNVVPLVIKYASSGDSERMVQAVDKLGESVNCTDSHQHNALFYAALYGHKKCLKELLKRGADPNQ